MRLRANLAFERTSASALRLLAVPASRRSSAAAQRDRWASQLGPPSGVTAIRDRRHAMQRELLDELVSAARGEAPYGSPFHVGAPQGFASPALHEDQYAAVVERLVEFVA